MDWRCGLSAALQLEAITHGSTWFKMKGEKPIELLPILNKRTELCHLNISFFSFLRLLGHELKVYTLSHSTTPFL
jgi:hypothetical protein